MATSNPPEKPMDPLQAPKKAACPRDSLIDIDGSTTLPTQEKTPPTISHEIAEENVDMVNEQRRSQNDARNVEVRDLGWNAESNEIARPIVQGLRNEQLWTIMRRFNQQTFEVKQINETTLEGLDMNIGDDEEFSPDKLRAHLTRLYVSVVLGCLSVWKHVARIRSWKEPNRTWAFFSVYHLAWLLDLLFPTAILCMLVLLVSPSAQRLCFPSAPLALIDAKSGGIQKPAGGVLATSDTMTGAPEAREGEGAEQEAHSVINTIARMVVATTVGQHPQDDIHEDDDQIPDPAVLAGDMADAKNDASQNIPSKSHDKTKIPVSQTVWKQARPVMRTIANIVDTWERFANAMNPTPPFPRDTPRQKLVICLLPILLASWYCTAYMLVKGVGLIVGIMIFGQPILARTAAVLERLYPNWQQFVALQNSILRGVPTNAQLAITLLRTGERSGTPIPPPPESETLPPMETNEEAVRELHVGATNAEIQNAARPQKTEEVASESGNEHTRSNGKMHVAVATVKRVAKGVVNTALTMDHAKAAAGARHAKERLGVVDMNVDRSDVGPVRFGARYKGKEGYVYVTEVATTPALSWTPNNGNLKYGWAVLICDITRLRKVGGLGWKSTVAVGWTLQKQIWNGLIVTTDAGEEWHLTALVGRDDIFNRLIALGNQMWELR